MAKKINVVDQIKSNARNVYDKIMVGQKPTMNTPVRSLANVKYLEKKGHFQIQDSFL